MFTEAEKQLQNALITTYLANLAFLGEYDNPLYQRIERLSNVINTGEYKERYQLEFINEYGEFDIYDNKDAMYLYKKDAKKYNNKLINSVNFDKKGSFSIFDEKLFDGRKYDIDVDLKTLQDAVHSAVLLFKDINKYNKILEVDVRDEIKLKNVDKFIFVGTLLGRHIPKIAKKLKAKNYFVLEPNLEIFRLSLFVVDYTILTEDANVRFSIMDENIEFNHKMEDFLFDNSFSNHTLKYITTDYNVAEEFDNIINSILMYKPTTFNYYMVLDVVFRNVVNRINRYPFLLLSRTEDRFTFFDNKSVIFAGAGPSLDDNINWLAKYQNKFVIFCMGASYKKLIAHNIKPDVVCTLDASEGVLLEKQFNDSAIARIQDSLFFASTNTSQKILNKVKDKNVFIYEVLSSIKEEGISLGGFSIGEVMFKLLLNLNIKELYLLGTDLALNQETGFTHIKDSASSSQDFNLNDIAKYNSMETGIMDFGSSIIEKKGNIKEKVFTTRQFVASLYSYNSIMNSLEKENVNVYNLSNHGVYIDKCIPTLVENVDTDNLRTIDKSNLTYLLREELGLFSENKINDFEKEKLLKEIVFLEEQLLLLNEIREISFNIYEDFLKKISPFILNLMTSDTSFAFRVFRYYFDTVNTFIDYSFKDSRLKKEKKKINEINKLWTNNVEILIKRYITYIKIALEE